LVLDPAARNWISGIVLALPEGDSVPEVLAGGTGSTMQRRNAAGERVLEALDQYEGPQFRRRECEVILESGRRLSCWVYEFMGHLRNAREILSGEWSGPRVE
jgi:hypothetical protein